MKKYTLAELIEIFKERAELLNKSLQEVIAKGDLYFEFKYADVSAIGSIDFSEEIKKANCSLLSFIKFNNCYLGNIKNFILKTSCLNEELGDTYVIQNAIFEDCKINLYEDDKSITGMTFKNCLFYGEDSTMFKKATFVACNFYNCNFNHISFKDTLFDGSSMYYCKFENTVENSNCILERCWLICIDMEMHTIDMNICALKGKAIFYCTNINSKDTYPRYMTVVPGAIR